MLNYPETGKNYGVFGQEKAMPATSKARAYDQSTSLFPRGLLLTIAPNSKATAPVGKIVLEFGAYPFDTSYELLAPSTPATPASPDSRPTGAFTLLLGL